MGEERRRAEEFTEQLRGAYGADLVAVVLYGSAARGEYREGVSDLNLLVVLSGSDAATLRRGSRVVRKWVEGGERPPLVMGDAEWKDSADVFPIEYSDMRDSHVVLHGDDPFEGISVDWNDLRLQCEHEIKAKELQLREHFLLSAHRPEELGKLLLAALPTFLTFFRTALRLAGAEVPKEAGQVAGAIAERAGFDAGPVREVIAARGSEKPFEPAGDGPVVTGYIDAVARTAAWVDGLQPRA
ncbi:MAG TPA: nucleotidyltransferase domain-containing protein [Longimicrobiaceae bacterium]|nr:nucleotidyltransferase domain-containing protein [Longimicrobiaceae bacterium]